MTDHDWSRLGLKYNPFEPSASGAPVRQDLWIPDSWRDQLVELLDTLAAGTGAKAIPIEGEYGSGKTYLLRWLERHAFPGRRIRPFFFDNPGVQFYDLANNLLREIGRHELAKTLWEYLRPQIHGLQLPLIDQEDSFIALLRSAKKQKRLDEVQYEIATSIRKQAITSDEEIAHHLARVVVETLDKPYFEYRDFVAGRRDSLVAEREEAKYFSAIIRALNLTSSAEGVAFLVDEFEEISLQKRLSKRQAYDYLATLKRLINVAVEENFWLVVSMTPQAAKISRELEPSLWQRFTGEGEYQFEITPLERHEAIALLQYRLEHAQTGEEHPTQLWPFRDDIIDGLQPSTYSSPRRLVKVAFYSIAEAMKDTSLKLPLDNTLVAASEKMLYLSDKN